MTKPHGTWSNKKGQGEGITFLLAHVDYDGPDCLIWPMSRNPNGYGQLGFEGKALWAHRKMCELANGPAPEDKLEAAHSCGRGHDGCVHPKHLSWKSTSENLLDCREHGTQVRSRNGVKGRLTPEQVEQIRGLRGQKTQAEIAAMFAISQPTVRDIFHGRSHKPNPRIRAFTESEDTFLLDNASGDMGMVADHLGRTEGSVRSRLYRLERKSRTCGQRGQTNDRD